MFCHRENLTGPAIAPSEARLREPRLARLIRVDGDGMRGTVALMGLHKTQGVSVW
jgi:hypothetical protein